MRKYKGFSAVFVVIGLLIVAALGFSTYLIIDGNNKATNFSNYDFNSIISATKDNGGISDHVKGSSDAQVLIFEYADFQCPTCAVYNPYVNKAISELDGKLAVVYRSFLLSYHQNATAAASAAEAAGLQGYWKEYSDKLFSEQSEWEYSSASERTEYFNKYFESVTKGEGDIEKFNSDIASEAVSRKISFDMGVGKRVDVAGTPAFYIDGYLIDFLNRNGGTITVNGKTFNWDGPMTGPEFVELLENIVKAKLGEE